MTFWGVKLEPGKPYTHGYNSSFGRLRISREHVFVQCEVGNRSPIYLCLLDANNEKEEIVVFEVIGNRSAGNEVSGSASQVAEVKNEVNVLEMGRDSGYKETVVNGCHVRTMASGLVIEDLETSNNRQIAYHGCEVCIRYFAQIKSTGYVFESNYATTLISYVLLAIRRFLFILRFILCLAGKGHLMKGLEDGINGMHVGDRRRLTVPPSLGYCGSKAWSDVPADTWLVREVDLESVRDVPLRQCRG
ncbi:hypothetical protein MKW92_007427 [Papaver armeniacum]|nr:hypothetical protein MKW92_007427 [Papaver armeniacum]